MRLYRGEQPEFVAGEDEEVPGEEPDLKATFPKLKYADVEDLDIDSGLTAETLEEATA